mgnify:CR=1 FL=1|jgi:predicted O-methyltransferase YrrM
MTVFESSMKIPELARRAEVLARERQFSRSSLPETGRLLAVLAATVNHGRIGEIGTGCGYGAAWIASALQSDTTLYTIEIDDQLARDVQTLLADHPQVRVLHGDWRELAAYGPFDLLFADGGGAKRNNQHDLIEMVTIGGMIILDDLTPEEYWPDEWKGQPDDVREFWLRTDRVVATEVRVTERHAVILATRRY